MYSEGMLPLPVFTVYKCVLEELFANSHGTDKMRFDFSQECLEIVHSYGNQQGPYKTIGSKHNEVGIVLRGNFGISKEDHGTWFNVRMQNPENEHFNPKHLKFAFKRILDEVLFCKDSPWICAFELLDPAVTEGNITPLRYCILLGPNMFGDIRLNHEKNVAWIICKVSKLNSHDVEPLKQILGLNKTHHSISNTPQEYIAYMCRDRNPLGTVVGDVFDADGLVESYQKILGSLCRECGRPIVPGYLENASER